MSTRLRWAVLGPGSIARRFATHLPHSELGVLAGVGSREAGRARAFAQEFDLGADAVIGDYDEVLASGLSSESSGTEPRRYVVVIPEAGTQAEADDEQDASADADA